MDHSLKSIAFIADLGELLIVMARVRLLQPAASGGEAASGSGSGSATGIGACTCAAGGAAAAALANGSAGGGSRRSSNPSSRDDPHGLSQSLNAPRPPAGAACKCADHSLEPCPLHGQHVKVCTCITGTDRSHCCSLNSVQ